MVSPVSAAGDDDELDDQKAAVVETAIAAPDTVADFDLGAYHARLARDNAPTVRCLRRWQHLGLFPVFAVTLHRSFRVETPPVAKVLLYELHQ